MRESFDFLDESVHYIILHSHHSVCTEITAESGGDGEGGMKMYIIHSKAFFTALFY